EGERMRGDADDAHVAYDTYDTYAGEREASMSLAFLSPWGVAGPLTVHAASASTSALPLALAFVAGGLATLNPCGFALLRAYVVYVLGRDTSDDQGSATKGGAAGGQTASWGRMVHGGLLGLPLTAGFLLVFLLAGGVLALGGRVLTHLFPWLAILVGLSLVALGGGALLPGRAPGVAAPGRAAPE